ncbi:MAG: low affinity iron permease family protein [Verrucomicrobia bacterium]|nr:low affinity iron permease family protein [Verrucomicrobiota bacterium]
MGNNHKLPDPPTPPALARKFTFRSIAEKTAKWLGSSTTFSIATLLIVLWGLSGLYFHFSDTWQLIINTGTTICTFLIVILIQNTQTRESRSIQLKLDELLYGTKNTRDSLMNIEEQSDAEIDAFQREYKLLREKYLNRHKKKSPPPL